MSIKPPNLFIVGAPKCGTTALYTYLKSHPDIFFHPKRKEPHHFSTDLPGNLWHPEWNDYLSLYSSEDAQSAIYRGDASVNYLYSSEAAANIASKNPSARIIICLRDIVPFIKSFHNQKLANLDEEITDLETAWRSSNSRNGGAAREPKLLDYKAIGRFASQIDRYRRVFPNEQIRIIKLESFKNEPLAHYKALLSWLEVSDDNRNEFERINSAATYRSRNIAEFIKYPPPWVVGLTSAIKRPLGLHSLGLAQVMARLNKVDRYAADNLEHALVEEIATHYAGDQAMLKRHQDLWLIKPNEMKRGDGDE